MRHPVCLPCRFPKPHCASVAHCLCHCSCCRCQLVRIYRKVENPLPFAPAASTRALTTAYLHARYAGLLLAPVQLSGGWMHAAVRRREVGGQREEGSLIIDLPCPAMLPAAAAAPHTLHHMQPTGRTHASSM